jgi:hypothetical protein
METKRGLSVFWVRDTSRLVASRGKLNAPPEFSGNGSEEYAKPHCRPPRNTADREKGKMARPAFLCAAKLNSS